MEGATPEGKALPAPHHMPVSSPRGHQDKPVQGRGPQESGLRSHVLLPFKGPCYVTTPSPIQDTGSLAPKEAHTIFRANFKAAIA